MKNFYLTLILSLVILTGCASAPPTLSEIKNADYGSYPINYKKIIEARVKANLIDEDSAKFRFSAPPRRTWTDSDQGRLFGHGVCVDVNAKNRMGGYTGYKTNYFIIKNDHVIYSEDTFCHKGYCMAPSKCR